MAQLLLLLWNRWKVPLHCREGSTVSALRHLAQCACFVFPPLLFPAPALSGFLLFSQQSFNDSNTVPNHGMAVTLVCADRELTYISCLAYSAARALRAGGGTRNTLLQRRFRSAISRSTLHVPAGVGPGSPSRDAVNWLPSRFSLSVEMRRRFGWLRMMVFPGAHLFRASIWCPSGGWRHARGREHCRGEPGSSLSGGYAPDSAKAESNSIVDEPGEG